MLRAKITTIAAAAAAVLATALPAAALTIPAAGPATATATTRVSLDPDNGHGTPSEWALDAMTRTVTVTRGAQVPGTACGLAAGAACWRYTSSLSDNGTFTTRPGAGTPNQACAGCNGLKIKTPAVTGYLYGAYQVTFYASSGSPQARLVPAGHDDHGLVPSAPYTSTTWGELFFPAGTHFGVFTGGAYSWTYTAVPDRGPFRVEQWVDSSANNDGNSLHAGNITG